MVNVENSLHRSMHRFTFIVFVVRIGIQLAAIKNHQIDRLVMVGEEKPQPFYSVNVEIGPHKNNAFQSTNVSDPTVIYW